LSNTNESVTMPDFTLSPRYTHSLLDEKQGPRTKLGVTSVPMLSFL